jgi:hypothetical protein
MAQKTVLPHDDEDDTARLILIDNPRISVTDFHIAMKEEHPDLGLVRFGDLCLKYRGMDGHLPTHSAETGRRL